MKTILLVDDEVPLRAALAEFLRSQQFVVLEADSSVEALAIIANTKIDFAICDVFMPEATGLELADLLSAKNTNLPILFITGYSEQVFGRTREGYLNFLQKPFPLHMLLARIHEMLPTGQDAEVEEIVSEK